MDWLKDLNIFSFQLGFLEIMILIYFNPPGAETKKITET